MSLHCLADILRMSRRLADDTFNFSIVVLLDLLGSVLGQIFIAKSIRGLRVGMFLSHPQFPVRACDKAEMIGTTANYSWGFFCQSGTIGCGLVKLTW